MAGVKETATWENHIYQIEENDPVHGGEEGVTNKPIKHLANRTLYLRKLLTEAGQRIQPKKITGASKNSVDLTGHTHEIESASTSAKGLVQLTNDTGLDSEVLALTAKAGKALAQSIAQAKLDTTNGLNKKVDKTSISDSVTSTSQTAVASSRAVKTAHDKGVEAKTAADNAQRTANAKQSPATTLAGYGISDAIEVKGLYANDLNLLANKNVVYYVNNMASLPNSPPNAYNWGVLVTISQPSFGVQLYYADNGEIWSRTSWQGRSDIWKEWQRLDGADWQNIRNKVNAALSQRGIVQLTNDTGLDSEVLALTAKAGKALAQSIAQAKLDTTNGLNKKVDKTSISDSVTSTSQTAVASSRAVKTAHDKGVEAKTAADNAQRTANAKQSPATTLAGYGISDAIEVKGLYANDLNLLANKNVVYYVNNMASLPNSPPNAYNWGVLVTISQPSFGVQLYYADNGEIWSRTSWQGRSDIWKEWQRLDGADWDGLRNRPDNLVYHDKFKDVTGRTFRATYQDEDMILGAIAFRENADKNNYTRYCKSPEAVRRWLGLHTSATRWPTDVEQGFSHSLGKSGWAKLPSGLLLQWGEKTNRGTHTFPIAFNECYQVIISDRSYSNAIDTGTVTNITNTNFTVYARDIGNFSFFAIGQ